MGRLTSDQKMLLATAFLAATGVGFIGYGVFSKLTEDDSNLPKIEAPYEVKEEQAYRIFIENDVTLSTNTWSNRIDRHSPG